MKEAVEEEETYEVWSEVKWVRRRGNERGNEGKKRGKVGPQGAYEYETVAKIKSGGKESYNEEREGS